MVLLADIAKKHGVNPSTLSVKLWEAGIECSSYRMQRGRALREYDAGAVKQIARFLKDNPVRRKVGRPKKRRKT